MGCGVSLASGSSYFSVINRVSNQANLLSEVDGLVMDDVNQHVDDFIFNITCKCLPRGVCELTRTVLVNHTCKKRSQIVHILPLIFYKM